MKKYLALVLSVLFVLSFAASAFAIHAEIPSETTATVAKGETLITLGGEIRTRGWFEDNIANLAFAAPFGFLDGLYPVKTGNQAWYDERVRLSVDATVAPGIKGYVMLETGAGQSDVYTWGNFNSKPSSMDINEAWMVYSGSGLFGFNSGLKIGHMPLALGQKEFFDHTKFGDDAIVFFMSPTKQLEIALLTIKFAEQNKRVNVDDLDGYVGLMTYKLDDKNTVGINYTFLNNSDGTATGTPEGFHQHNVGLHADGNIAGFGYMATGDIQFGEAFENTVNESDFEGYALQLGLSYNINPVTVRAKFAMGSGSEENDSDIGSFVTFLGNDQHYTLVYEYQVQSAALGLNTGLSNTTYYNIGVDYSPTKEVGLSLDGYILRATEEIFDGADKDAGWEIDAKMTYQLAKNLKYQIDAGYFKAGDMYDDILNPFNIDAKGATVLRHAITLSF